MGSLLTDHGLCRALAGAAEVQVQCVSGVRNPTRPSALRVSRPRDQGCSRSCSCSTPTGLALLLRCSRPSTSVWALAEGDVSALGCATP